MEIRYARWLVNIPDNAIKYTQEMGTGLGLGIVKRLVDAYKGKIEIQSTVGEGTTVSLRLPLVPS